MYFKRIELNGFKSFADPVSIEFSEGITCIVGPNGSGKSNVSDAIRWVLGEQSPKMLRGGKMEEVIFAGTQSRKARGMAEVTLVIDNSSHILPIDYAEVGITRRMYRSGDSEYMINRVPCRLRDIRELIMDTGIGVEGYSIIGQGRIADIVGNKMGSRREIFEEAAGIVKYRSKKADAERKLESTSANLARVNDIVHEIEGRIDGLREDSEKAAEYLQIREKYRDVEINITLKNIEAAESKTAAIRAELENMQQSVADCEAAKLAADEELRALRSSAEQTEARLSELRAALMAKTEEIHEIQSRSALNRERSAALLKDRERLGTELGQLGEKLEKELAAGEEQQRSLEEAAGAAKAAKDGVRAKRAVSEALSAELAEAEDGAEELKDKMFELSGSEASARAEAAGLEGLKATLEKRREKLSQEAPEEGSLKDLEESENKASEAAKQLRGTASELSAQLEKCEKDSREAALQEARAISDIGELQVNEGKMSARLRLLEELESSYEGYGGAVKFVMELNMPGIHGVLGDMLDVPAGWELAIETVLGAKLQNIVCETDATAKRAIDMLKEFKAGRLTFLPVQSLRVQKPASVASVEDCRGFLGLASDEVRCQGYDKVVDYLLGKVVVCDRLDNAIAMSKKSDNGLRFVTLEGEVINAAGAITGGSVKSNTVNLLSRKAEKTTLEKDLKKIARDIEDAEDTRGASRARVNTLAGRRAELEIKIRENAAALAVSEKELEQIRLSMQGAKAGEERRRLELEDLEREIGNAARSAAEKLAEAEGFAAQQGAARSDAEALASKADELREKLDAAIEEENEARIEESNAALKARSAEELAARVAERIAELQAEKAAKEKELSGVALGLEQIDQFTGSADEVLAEREAQRAAIEEETAALDARRGEASDKQRELEERRSALEASLYENQLRKHDAEVRLARFDAQTDSLKDKLWQDFELSYAQAAELASDDFVMSRAMRESREYRDRLRELGDVNVGAIEEYKAVKERYDFLIDQRADINKASDELKTLIADMDRVIKTNFKESFDMVVENFEKSFSQLFKGGHARLSLEDPENPLDCAIEIEAQPPGKKLQNINLLSGGEKTLTAIALMLAVLNSKPTPFCILDEIEAALDETNIDSVARYLKDFGKTQFALITHQKATMEYADALYGVTMPEQGVSKVLSLRLGDDFKLD